MQLEDCELTLAQAEHFASLALACIGREYPNKISHLLNSPDDAKHPRELTPAFFGCYDWHSAVHNHWALVRLLRVCPSGSFVGEAKRALDKSLTAPNIEKELAYMRGDGRESFERPYGLAWLLQLVAELREAQIAEAKQWSSSLKPLEEFVSGRLAAWLPRLTRPVRNGEHTNLAFAMSLMLDYSRSAQNVIFEELLTTNAKRFYLQDQNCPLNYEPSGEDFLSPCLAEADLMRRVLPVGDFANWLTEFLPRLSFEPEEISDELDGKLGHLIGLDLSRAWMLAGVLSHLPREDPRRPALSYLQSRSQKTGLGRLNTEHYHGAHWLGTFAVYLLSGKAMEHRVI